jgi:hypothetical protein
MDNVYAWRLGECASKSEPGGDYIDRGWSLLKLLHEKGFDVVVREDGAVNKTFHPGKTLNAMCHLKPPQSS